jgi:hypothetical protein
VPAATPSSAVTESPGAGGSAVVEEHQPARVSQAPAAPSVRPIPAVVSRFARDDDEGWRTAIGLGFGEATESMMINTDGTNFWLTARGASDQNAWGWLAPAKFLGDQSGALGRSLGYSMRVNHSTSNVSPGAACSVRIRGGGREIFADTRTSTRRVAGAWTHFRFRLDSSGGWFLKKNDGQAETASDEDIKRVLADVTELWIKGEREGPGADTGDLDDVALGGEAENERPDARTAGSRNAPPQVRWPSAPAMSPRSSPASKRPAGLPTERAARAVALLKEGLGVMRQMNFYRNPERGRTRDRSIATVQDAIKQIESGKTPVQRLQGVRKDLGDVQRVAVVASNKNLLSRADSLLKQTIELLMPKTKQE